MGHPAPTSERAVGMFDILLKYQTTQQSGRLSVPLRKPRFNTAYITLTLEYSALLKGQNVPSKFPSPLLLKHHGKRCTKFTPPNRNWIRPLTFINLK